MNLCHYIADYSMLKTVSRTPVAVLYFDETKLMTAQNVMLMSV